MTKDELERTPVAPKGEKQQLDITIANHHLIVSTIFIIRSTNTHKGMNMYM